MTKVPRTRGVGDSVVEVPEFEGAGMFALGGGEEEVGTMAG